MTEPIRGRTPVPEELVEDNFTSEPQKKFIGDLLEEKDLSQLSDEQRQFLSTQDEDGHYAWERIPRKRASDIISTLLALRKLPKPNKQELSRRKSEFPETENGYYAVVDPIDDKLKFYRVKNGEYQWTGFIFLDVYASDTRYPIKKKDHKLAILQEIAKDPRAAQARFGQEIGRCGVCGRTLTDETSRAIGIGPVCREGGGW